MKELITVQEAKTFFEHNAVMYWKDNSLLTGIHLSRVLRLFGLLECTNEESWDFFRRILDAVKVDGVNRETVDIKTAYLREKAFYIGVGLYNADLLAGKPRGKAKVIQFPLLQEKMKLSRKCP